MGPISRNALGCKGQLTWSCRRWEMVLPRHIYSIPAGTLLPISDLSASILAWSIWRQRATRKRIPGTPLKPVVPVRETRQRLQKAAHVSHLHGSGQNIGVPCNARPDEKPPFAVIPITSSVKGSLRRLQTPCGGLPSKTLRGCVSVGLRQAVAAGSSVGLGLCSTPKLYRVQARSSGIPVALVHPKHTSQQCQ